MSRRPIFLAALCAVLCVGSALAQAESRPAGWAAVLADGRLIDLIARPVQLTGGTLQGASLHGAWVLTGNRPEFGSFSGLVIRDGQLYAVTDNAWWLGAEIVETGGELELRSARMARIRDAEGSAYTKTEGDAEGLTWYRGHLMVSFERDHRIMRLGPDGRMGEEIVLPAFSDLRNNRGLEGLATLPDTRPPGGGLIVLAEGRDKDGAPIFVLRADGRVSEHRLPLRWLHSVTGADIGPDGRLYLVLREHSALFGLSIRVMRYSLGDAGLPVPESAEVLAAFEADSGIDNMEGISVEPRPEGGIRLWLISDDNFRSTQRTLLMALDVAP